MSLQAMRMRDAAGVYRTCYFTKSKRGILIPHAFVKKTQKTPPHKIDLARRPLKETDVPPNSVD